MSALANRDGPDVGTGLTHQHERLNRVLSCQDVLPGGTGISCAVDRSPARRSGGPVGVGGECRNRWRGTVIDCRLITGCLFTHGDHCGGDSTCE